GLPEIFKDLLLIGCRDPGPVSATETRQAPSEAPTSIFTSPTSMNLMAFPIVLANFRRAKAALTRPPFLSSRQASSHAASRDRSSRLKWFALHATRGATLTGTRLPLGS